MYRHAVIFVFCWAIGNVNSVLAQMTLNSLDGLPDLGRSSAVWADFNNDGALDVAITGINQAGSKEAGIYFNNTNGTFSNSGTALIPVSDGDLEVNDYNNDGNVDLLLMGVDASGTKQSRLYKNEGSGVFTVLALSLEGLGYGAAVFADLNNDGKADLLMNGLNNQNQSSSVCYLNNGNGTFSLKQTNISASSYGDLLTFDCDNDSFLDVLVSGLNANNQRIMHLYLNKGKGIFVKKETVLPALRSGGMAAADMDNDGYTDLFISGSSSGASNHAAVYKNNAGAGFVLVKTLLAVSDGGGAWGDYNNDGYADLALFGFDKTDLKSIIYQNTGGTDFVDSGIPLPGASQGHCSWMDYNKDNRLDFLLTGYSGVPFTSVYMSGASANTVPAAPSNLSFTALADSVILSWDAPSDAETTGAGLTYNLYIGSSSGAFDVKAPEADLSNGLRKIAFTGRVKSTRWILPHLTEGTYYWAVQAIDAGFGASPFSTEATAVSCAPVVITGEDKVCLHAALALAAGQPEDQVTWYSKTNANLLIGTGRELNYTLNTKDTIVTKVIKSLGCTVYDTLAVDVWPLPVVNAGEDQKSCFDKEVELQATSAVAPVQWFEAGQETTVLFTGSVWSRVVTREQSLVTRVTDDKGCQGTDTVAIGLYPQPVVDLGADQIVCIGSELSWSAGLPSDSVNWYTQAKGSLSKNDVNVSLKAEEADLLWAEVFNAERCVSYDTVSIGIYSLPVANAGEDQLICGEQDAVRIGDAQQDPSGLSFVWEPSQSLDAADVPHPLASPQTDTKYIVWVKDQHECENSDTVWVYLNPLTLIQAGQDRSVCIGSSTVLGGTPTASGSNLPYAFQWSPSAGLSDASSPNPTASPTQPTTYILQVIAGDCPAGSAEVTVSVNTLPLVRANEDLTVGAEQSVTLSVEGAATYEWFPEELFADPTSSQPVVYPNRSTVYRVQGKDLNGCLNSDTIRVTVRSDLFIPSLFTPNDDDLNGIFRAHGFGIKTITLNVFDRWGRLLFSSSDLNEGWDGRFNGQPVESGNYVWTVEGEFFDGNALLYKGQNRGIIKLLR